MTIFGAPKYASKYAKYGQICQICIFGVRDIPKFGLLVFLGHPNVDGTLLVADSPTSRLVKISTGLLFTGEVVEDPK